MSFMFVSVNSDTKHHVFLFDQARGRHDLLNSAGAGFLASLVINHKGANLAVFAD